MGRDNRQLPGYYLSHSEPMILLNRYVDDVELGVVCEVDISKDSMFFENNHVPAFVGIEYMAQTIGVFAGVQNRKNNVEIDIGFLLGSRKIDFNTEKFAEGTTLKISCGMIFDTETIKQFDCTIDDKKTDQNLMTACLSVYLPPKSDYKKEL